MSKMSAGRSGLKIGGVLKVRAFVSPQEVDRICMSGLSNYAERFDPNTGLVLLTGEKHNAFVNTGLQITLDRLFALSGPPAAVSHMGITDDANAVTATETLIDPGANSNKTIIALVNKSRSGQTTSVDATYTKANANFVIRKVALLNTSTDAGTGLINVIGGGGSSPYNESFAIDLTGATSFNLTLGIDVTAQAA